jgi:hypothetical protein
VSLRQFQEWEKRPEFSGLRAKAQGLRKQALLDKIEAAGRNDWRCWAWLLERTFPEQFGNPAKVQICAQQNNYENYQLSEEKAKEIDARAQRLRKELGCNDDGHGSSNGLGSGGCNGNGQGDNGDWNNHADAVTDERVEPARLPRGADLEPITHGRAIPPR